MHSSSGPVRVPRRGVAVIAIWALLLGAIAPELQAQFKPQEKEISRFRLDNGLEVVIVENHLVPIATVELAVRNGSFTEGPEYSGLSHLYEHMFFKGNSRYADMGEFLSMLGQIGAAWNATTREEVVYYYFTLPVTNLERGMEEMANTVQTPLFEPVSLEKEREVVLGELTRFESDPFYEFNRAMDKAMWGDYVTRKQKEGQRDVIRTATVEKMRAIQKKYYLPNNSLLIVAGDVDSATVARMANKYFRSWKKGDDPFVKDPVPMPKPLAEKQLVVVPAPGADLAQVSYQWHGPSIGKDDEATYAADVLIFILQQQQSRFHRRLVESGLSQGAALNYYTQRYVGPISASVVTTPEKTREALNALWSEIQELDSPDYFTDEELETAKQILRINALYESEQTTDWVHSLSFWWSTAGIEYYRTYIDKLLEVSREDIQRYVRTYIKNKPYVLGVSTNPQALDKLNLHPKEVLQ
jgi:zinc protease